MSVEFSEALDTLDALTPVYRLRVARLPKVERRVLFALAMLDGPQRAMDITDAARVGARATSTMLTRLKRRGEVLHHDRRWLLADPWLQCWFRMRRRLAFDVPAEPPPRLPSIWETLLLANAEAL